MRSTGFLHDGSFGPTGGWAGACASSNDRGHSEDVLSPWLQRESNKSKNLENAREDHHKGGHVLTIR
jgi:hypothetical protein